MDISGIAIRSMDDAMITLATGRRIDGAGSGVRRGMPIPPAPAVRGMLREAPAVARAAAQSAAAREAVRGFVGVIIATLVPVVLTAFLSLPYILARTPGSAPAGNALSAWHPT